ncbi:MAG: hypothetical protein HS104_00135 [Polyangiaceae bacterium]|nr:hypothetical protein [Polyangiaceae bacterium]MCL4755732.1 hypothetical protein [Myxococcales bacterium]
MHPRLLTPRILWGALLASTVLFLVVLFVQPHPPSIATPILAPALGAVAIGLAIFSFVLPMQQQRTVLQQAKVEITEAPDPNASGVIPYRDAPKRRVFADPKAAENTAFVNYQTSLILGCALSEAIAIFGFMLGFLGHPPVVFLPFFVASWVLIGVRFPTLARVRGPLEKAKGAVFPD